MRRAAPILCLLILALGGLPTGCGPAATDVGAPLREQAPFLGEREAAILAETDPEAFTEAIEPVSTDRIIRLVADFHAAVFGDSTSNGALRAELLPPYRRLVDVLAVRHCPEYRAALDHFLELEPDRARELVDLAARQDEIFTSAQEPPTVRLERLEEVHDQLIAANHELAVAEGWGYRGALATRAGQPELTREMFTRWLEHAHERGLRVARCNALASLIMQGFAEGNTDSTSVYLERGLRLAHESRLAAQASRLLALTGYRDFSLGHYSSAVRSFERAVDTCRNYGDPAQGLGHLSTLMRMYAVMESWTLVDQISQRADLLMTEAQAHDGDSYRTTLLAVRLDEIEARSLISRGRIEEAHAAYDELWQRIMHQPYEEASFLANFWIMGLLDHDRPDLAAAALEKAEPYADEAGIRHMQLRVPFWKARTFFQLGRLDSATVYLDRFEQEGLQHVQWSKDLQIPHFALRCRLKAATDRDAAARILAEGMDALTHRLAENDAGAGAFLDLSRARGLRWAAHDEFGADPATGYGLELLWRRYMGTVGHEHEHVEGHVDDILGDAGVAAAAAQRRLGELGATHLLYQVREPWVVRWTVDAHAVRRDTLSVPSSRIRNLVGYLHPLMANDPGHPDLPLGDELQIALRELSELLLPVELRRPPVEGKTGPLFISGESFLSQIPFAPLDIGRNGEYEPLALHRDVAWVRSPATTTTGRTGGAGLLIANPKLDPVLVRRYRTLAQLAGTGPEIAACREICPGPELEGVAATKSAVTAAWSSASVIYFLGHVIHNPEVPFLTTIPLTPPAGAHLPIEAALDIADVRSADLRGCRLAVLSGCGSGAPFADGVITAPSLGDAFLDAGAGASLQTFWRIRDENPVFRPEEVVRRWKTEGLSLTEAVSAERRAALRGPDGIRHPFGWAAWSLKMADFNE